MLIPIFFVLWFLGFVFYVFMSHALVFFPFKLLADSKGLLSLGLFRFTFFGFLIISGNKMKWKEIHKSQIYPLKLLKKYKQVFLLFCMKTMAVIFSIANFACNMNSQI